MLHDHSHLPACCLPALLLRTSREPDHGISSQPFITLLTLLCFLPQPGASISIPCYPFTVNTSLTTSSLKYVSAFGSHRAKIITPSKPWTHTVIKLRSQFHLNSQLTTQTKDKEHNFLFRLKHWGRHGVTANLAHLRGTILSYWLKAIKTSISYWRTWEENSLSFRWYFYQQTLNVTPLGHASKCFYYSASIADVLSLLMG